jgi:hypothetical protein
MTPCSLVSVYTNLAEDYSVVMFKFVLLLVVFRLPRYAASHPGGLLILLLAAVIGPGLIATGLLCDVMQVAVYQLCSLA